MLLFFENQYIGDHDDVVELFFFLLLLVLASCRSSCKGSLSFFQKAAGCIIIGIWSNFNRTKR